MSVGDLATREERPPINYFELADKFEDGMSKASISREFGIKYWQVDKELRKAFKYKDESLTPKKYDSLDGKTKSILEANGIKTISDLKRSILNCNLFKIKEIKKQEIVNILRWMTYLGYTK